MVSTVCIRSDEEEELLILVTDEGPTTQRKNGRPGNRVPRTSRVHRQSNIKFP